MGTDAWFENGALANAIKNPYKRIDTHAVTHDIVIKVDGEIVAQSKVAVLLNETKAKEAYYLPATSILDWGSVEKSDLKTTCPYKGEAWYSSLRGWIERTALTKARQVPFVDCKGREVQEPDLVLSLPYA